MIQALLDFGANIPPSFWIGQTQVAVAWRRSARARRYIIRYERPARVVATIPRGGSKREAWAFIQRSQSWIEQQMAKPSPAPVTETWFRGEKISIAEFDVAKSRALAVCELTQRTLELAAQVGEQINRVSIRNQRSRWGSCSLRRTISLNWRLIQTPPFVVDYIILHELMHLRQMNHSRRFWAEVEKVCPAWREAEAWLRRHGRDIIRR
jgi:predicted metal-dependent hydrolase